MSRILVVDDDADMRALVGVYLQAAGHTVEFAQDGVAGLEAVEKNLPDLVITDFQMPRMDGFGLFDAIRAHPLAATVPVVMITSHSSREMMKKALRLGVDDFLGKPLTKEDLLAVVGERLGAAPSAPAPKPTRAAAAQPDFVGSIVACEIRGLERFALALKKQDLEQVVAQFVAEAEAVALRNVGWLSQPDIHHVLIALEGTELGGHASRALRTALGLVVAAQRLKPWLASRFPGRDLPEFLVAVGIDTGGVHVAAGGPGFGAPTGDTVKAATFLAESTVSLGWSVAASQATAQATKFLVGRTAQLRAEPGGALKAVEVRGLEPVAQATAATTRDATLIEAAVDRNATLVNFAKAAPKVAPKPAPRPAAATAPPPSAPPTVQAMRPAPSRPAAPAAPLPAAPSVMAQPVYQPVPGYKALRKLSDNGIVAVYLVHPESGGAAEVMKTVLISGDPRKRPHFQKFVDQYSAIGKLDHPNLGRTTAQGLTEEHLYFVQEYCPGGDLRNLIAERMTMEAAVKALLRIAGALRVAHQHNIVHGDLKPANVMIRADGSLALVDFALARLIEYAAEEEGGTGMIMRSPDYLSPEMINNQPPDIETDIYTLGLVFYEMLTGQRAYASPDLSKVMMDHLEGAVPRLPAGLERFQPLLDRMMAKYKPNRLHSVHEVIASLARATPNAA